MLARRNIVKGLAGLPLATVLASPSLSNAAAMALENVTLTTEGGRKVHGALARPQSAPASAVMLIHEWWGLNDQIKSVAAALADRGLRTVCSADTTKIRTANSPATRFPNACASA